jgi:hypothetical protein
LSDLISRQTQPSRNRIEHEQITIFYAAGAALYRLKKIVQWNPNRPLARRANAILLLAKGKSKTKIAELLQAARSSVNRWINWYLTDDIDGLQADLPGRKVRFEPEFIGKLLRFMVGFRPQEFGYQRSRWSSELLSI